VSEAIEDSRALERVRGGDREAFRSLVERHQSAVYSFVLRLVRNPDAAEDIAQEAFVRAFASLDRFRAQSKFRTWVMQIALNLIRDRRRAEGRWPVVVSIEELRQRPDRPAASDPEASIADQELASLLEKALDSLPQDYREVFVLKHVEGLSYGEIAEMTGVSIGALKVRAHRARIRVREWCLDHTAGELDHGRHTGALSRR
jgi:RNA polymerase sigma-70 factor (ECF subfamily)